MKKNRNRPWNVFFSTISIMFLFIVLLSCGDKNDKGIEEYDPNKPIELLSFKPREGGVRDKFLLYGNNFGSDPSKVKVYFNKREAAVVSAEGDIMYAIVPRLPGDICKISVVIGKDSVTYDEEFIYNTTVSISTITGNGSQAFQAGTLAEGQLQARYISVDADDNIFAAVRTNATTGYGLIRINEVENIVTPLIWNTTSTPLNPNAPAVDIETGIVTVPHDGAKEGYFTFNPKEMWAPRSHSMTFTGGVTPSVNWKYAMAYTPYDGHVYMRYGSGQIFKLNPETNEASLVLAGPSEAGYGLAFHTLKPWLLYFAMEDKVAGLAHSIGVLDIRNPESGIKRLSSSITGGGHRDGALENAQFKNPRQLFFDPDGNLFVADYGNHCIRMITPDDIVETIAGQPGVSGMQDGGRYDALLNGPWGLAVGTDGTVYISDFNNCRIRKLVIE